MAFLTIAVSLLALPVALIIWTAQSLAKNKEKARATGLPYLVRWISPINPFWLLYGSSFVRLCRRLGIATENLTRIYSYGWEANARASIHVDHGDVFMVVTPGGNSLCVSNAELIYEILQRRTDFSRNMEEMAVLNVYGKNLSTTDGQEWQQHRKMTAVTFTEKNNELVWHQSLSQAEGMLAYWTERAPQPVRSTHEDTKVFTLNVLAAALFNRVYAFHGQAEEQLNLHDDGNSYQYRDSLSTILSSIIQIFIFGEQGLKAWWTPKAWKKAAEAVSTFRSYILGLMEEERTLASQGNIQNQHLVARLVRACRTSPSNTSATNAITLSEEEIISNLFVYAFAGNDTTSIALTNIIIHLAAHPETQDWIAEEINYYLGEAGHSSLWTFENFAKLKRCGAVIMESLRICHTLSQLVKTTGSVPQVLQIEGKAYTIPANTSVHCSLPALHSHPRYWGPDPLHWNPHRFISPASDAASKVSPDIGYVLTNEKLSVDTSSNYMPWAWGQRACPGKRFSQVELVAVLAVLFKYWKVEPDCDNGESPQQARARAWNSSLEVDHEGHMLHEMVDPTSVGLRWVKRRKP